ncbi:hypothetical protein [Staphylococcus kloosii]|uniref:hypothetical protein n=1 Tax=Staphylococcus kloosii TaxID=29384 RepID=UPI000D1ED585|nr:hypothetical protein [Staphylococcus kloosii]PTJ79270.1 hypothetical protein BUZ59_04370 [Staphylococcus kloosii]
MWSPVCELGKKESNVMKIKTKKQMNLPQLIEWAWENDFRNKVFESEGGFIARFDYDGCLSITKDFMHTDFFTVKVEEGITEDTKFKHLVFIDDCDLSASYKNKSINDIKYGHDKEFHAYIDGEFKCIWRDGKLLEE